MAHQHTYVMVKPDGVGRGVVGEVIRRFETRGFIIERRCQPQLVDGACEIVHPMQANADPVL